MDSPTAGIVAGCPLADVALRAVLEEPVQAAAVAAPGAATRGYADDMKVSSNAANPEDAAMAVIAGVRAFAQIAAPSGGT